MSDNKKRIKKSTSVQTNLSLSRLEDSRNLSDLEEIAAIGTSFAHKKALEISDEIIYANEGKIIRLVKGKKPEIIEMITPRKATKGEVLIIDRNRVNV